MPEKKIKSALISVYHKDNLEPLIRLLNKNGVTIYSTGGTEKFIKDLSIPVIPVEDLTSYPSVFGGRVKTLHPKVFGGILHRRANDSDLLEADKFQIPSIDLVIVDLYPFEETVSAGSPEEEIIEKIDIGGISLIRAAAKNFNDVLIVSGREQYERVITLLTEKNCSTTLSDRKVFAMEAFAQSSHYDTMIFKYFSQGNSDNQFFRESYKTGKTLRYGENPHQKGIFYGELGKMFEQLNGKELSYNNLVDVDAAVNLIDEFSETTFAILKHTNACGVASSKNLKEAYLNALAGDPVSAFGGVIITNQKLDLQTAEELNKLFFEVLIAPGYDDDALNLLCNKKNRIILKRNPASMGKVQYKTLLNGVILQDKDLLTETEENLKTVTQTSPDSKQIEALIFANKIAKHTKSNTIVLSDHKQLFASGVGQTSRVDALKQAIEKARSFNFDISGAVMASDAFFPFPDCVEIAADAGIKAILQPGGSIKDQDSIDACNKNGIAMVLTGIRHFKH
jgi:phosphoribosylaminoimidazolecarboxamide formyltransferase / IMP cyclohydrolase